MFYTENNNIVMTKGDSGKLNVKLVNKDGSEYTPKEGDKVLFSLKKQKDSYFPVVIEKEGTELVFKKEDTEHIPSGKYFYDVVILKPEERCTVIEGEFIIRKAVHEFE